MLETKMPIPREGEEEAGRAYTEPGGKLGSQLPNQGPLWPQLLPWPGPNIRPHAQADPRGQPSSFASSPPHQVRPASGEPPAASRRHGKEARGTYPASPLPSMCQLLPGCPSNSLSARSHGAGETEQGPPRGLLRSPFAGEAIAEPGTACPVPLTRACTSSPPLMPLTALPCRQQESCPPCGGGAWESPRDEATLSRQLGTC